MKKSGQVRWKMRNKNRRKEVEGREQVGGRQERKKGGGGGGARKRGEEVVNKSFCFHGDQQLQVHGNKALEDAKDGLLIQCCGHPSRHGSNSGGTSPHALETASSPDTTRLHDLGPYLIYWGRHSSIRPRVPLPWGSGVPLEGQTLGIW